MMIAAFSVEHDNLTVWRREWNAQHPTLSLLLSGQFVQGGYICSKDVQQRLQELDF